LVNPVQGVIPTGAGFQAEGGISRAQRWTRPAGESAGLQDDASFPSHHAAVV